MEDNIIRPTFAKRRTVPVVPLPPTAEAEANGRLRLHGTAGPHLVWVLYPETFGCGHEVKVLVGPRSGPIKKMAVMPATSKYNIAIELVADGVLRALKLAVGHDDGNSAA